MRGNYGLDVPVCLVGHSLGGRAAILAAGLEPVLGVVALNPFVYVQDGRVAADGHSIVIVHGTQDRIAPPARAEAAAELLRQHTPVAVVRVRGGKHAMLRRHDTFDGLAASVSAALLTGVVSDPARPVLDALHEGGLVEV